MKKIMPNREGVNQWAPAINNYVVKLQDKQWHRWVKEAKKRKLTFTEFVKQMVEYALVRQGSSEWPPKLCEQCQKFGKPVCQKCKDNFNG